MAKGRVITPEMWADQQRRIDATPGARDYMRKVAAALTLVALSGRTVKQAAKAADVGEDIVQEVLDMAHKATRPRRRRKATRGRVLGKRGAAASRKKQARAR
jgi:hypothetical protein